ncbi:MAG TPA: helix-turn-helix domain-containing protein [Dongiaceae bacterium]|jgi:AcrR family transcriptional regulator|nr:helix-turn-helix domain-containing protein [Dongiaceae bacterium]
MPRNPTATRTRIYAAAYVLFYRKGFQRTSLDDIAAKAGVTKRTLYYHVRSKDELAGAMLEHQHAFVLAEMARWIGPVTGKLNARKLVDRLFDSMARWAEKGLAGRERWTGGGFTRMAMELADLPGHPARVATRRHKATVEAELARRLAQSGAGRAPDLAAQIQILVEGAMILMLIHGDVRYARLARAAVRKLI